MLSLQVFECMNVHLLHKWNKFYDIKFQCHHILFECLQESDINSSVLKLCEYTVNLS